jgi:peptidoglycan/LPS O-acetylase OafA/YrhL
MELMVEKAASESFLDQRTLSSKKHFEVMDGLRGIAAMAVVLLHSFTSGGPLINSRLAVDLFFLLSGFVIAYSYDDILRQGMRISDFLIRRAIRLYPMVFVGALGGILIALVHNKTNPGDAYPLQSIATSGGLSLLVMPYLGHFMGPNAFSFNTPLWSLFFELIANLIYVLSARRLSAPVLIVIVAVSLIAIALGGPLGGDTKANILLGLPRVGAGFFGGVLLFKLWSAKRLPNINGHFIFLSVGILAMFGIPIEIGGWLFLPAYAFFLVVVICAIGAQSSKFDKYCALLGQISYPLYLTHWLTHYVFTWIGNKAGLTGSLYDLVAIVHFACAPFLAFLTAHYYETPIRLFLMRIYNSATAPYRLAERSTNSP